MSRNDLCDCGHVRAIHTDERGSCSARDCDCSLFIKQGVLPQPSTSGPSSPTFPARLAELHAAATPGPWRDRRFPDDPPARLVGHGEVFTSLTAGAKHYDPEYHDAGKFFNEADADLIVYLRNHTEAILALAKVAEAARGYRLHDGASEWYALEAALKAAFPESFPDRARDVL